VLPVTSAPIILCALSGSAYAASPTDKGAPGAEDNTAISTTVVVQPMRMHEPMPGEMKKDDMMKEEVMKGAKEKGKVMKDALQKEGAAMDRSTGSKSQSNKHRSKLTILQFNYIQEITMSSIKSTALGLIIACTFTLPALAADTTMKDGAMMMMTPDGKMMTMDKPDQMM